MAKIKVGKARRMASAVGLGLGKIYGVLRTNNNTDKVIDKMTNHTPKIEDLTDRNLETIIAKAYYYENNPDKLDLPSNDKEKFLELAKEMRTKAEKEMDKRKENEKMKVFAEKIIKE